MSLGNPNTIGLLRKKLQIILAFVLEIWAQRALKSCNPKQRSALLSAAPGGLRKRNMPHGAVGKYHR